MNDVEKNIKAHDDIAEEYDARHGEIFNEIEQARLRQSLFEASQMIKTKSKEKSALDFGAGSGNLTNHLVKIGLRVTACDVSPKFLQMIKRRFGDKVEVSPLNGEDLSQFPDQTFDMVATYSVLHHIPNYLAAVKELHRVTKKGGVIYIDHEVSPHYWDDNPEYQQFLELNPAPFPWKKLFSLRAYLTQVRKLFHPRYQAEGDIHVWPDDHIEWAKIRKVLTNAKAKIIREDDYLLYKGHYREDVYDEYKNKVSDMRVMVAQRPL